MKMDTEKIKSCFAKLRTIFKEYLPFKIGDIINDGERELQIKSAEISFYIYDDDNWFFMIDYGTNDKAIMISGEDDSFELKKYKIEDSKKYKIENELKEGNIIEHKNKT